MKKNDMQTLEMLQKELLKSAESVQVPLKLQKESVVAMLKNREDKETDFSDKTGTKNIVILRRLAASAAMIAMVIVCALFMRTGGVKVIKTDSFYEGYESVDPVRNARSYDEVERAVFEILEEKTQQSVEVDGTAKEDQTAVSTSGSSQNAVERFLEGYSKYVPEKELKEHISEIREIKTAEGIATYGDFKADIVKNDGEYLYVVTTGTNPQTGLTVEQIKIIKAVPAQEMQIVSTIVLSAGESSDMIDECLEIYLKNDMLIALVSSYSYSLSDSISTVAVYYDISDPASPVKLREHRQDGEYVSSSLHENRLSLVTEKYIPSVSKETELAESGVIPSFSVDGVVSQLKAEDIFIAVNDPEASYLFITVTDISDLNAQVGRLAVLGSGKEVYCLSNSIVAARAFVSVDADENGAYNSLTELYRFNISGSSIAFSGSYIVQGSLVGGVSVDENSGYMKAATSDSGKNNIYVLNEKMEFVSGLKDIFTNKKITSVKFIGSNAYVVAGEDSEKTMIIDFADPSKPKVAGTISTQDFSNELYAISDTLLIGVSENEKEQNITLSLFDVSNPDSPKTVSVYEFEGNCLLTSGDNGRCVMLASDKKAFGIPVVKHNPSTGTDVSAYVLFSVSDGTITPVGTYNHDTSYIGDAAVRGASIGDILYTVSGEKIVAFSIDECSAVFSQIIR